MIARPEETGPSEAQVIDARDGRVIRAVRYPTIRSFRASMRGNALILRERGDTGGPNDATWRFLRIDQATNVLGAFDGIPAIGPASSGTDDVDPAHGIAVTIGLAVNDEGASLLASSLTGGESRSIATFPSVDRLAIDPTGEGVAVAANDVIRFVTWDGRATDLWRGTDSASDFAWSADGTDLVVATDSDGGSIALVERATGRVVQLPATGPVAQTLLVRVIGGVPAPGDAASGGRTDTDPDGRAVRRRSCGRARDRLGLAGRLNWIDRAPRPAARGDDRRRGPRDGIDACG